MIIGLAYIRNIVTNNKLNGNMRVQAERCIYRRENRTEMITARLTVYALGERRVQMGSQCTGTKNAGARRYFMCITLNFTIKFIDLFALQRSVSAFTVKLLATRNRAMLRRIAVNREEKSKVCYGKTTRISPLILHFR